jgi:hypothetical protein
MWMSFSQVFDEALKVKKAAVQKIDKRCVLVNPDAKQVYSLKGHYKSSPNSFVCHDSSGVNLHLKIIPCLNYSHLRSSRKRLLKISSLCDSEFVLDIVDVFEVLDQERWYLVIVTPLYEAVTVAQLAEAVQSKGLRMEKDFCIAVMIRLIKRLETVYMKKKNYGLAYPSNVMICKAKPGEKPFYSRETSFSLKVINISRNVLNKDKNSEKNDQLNNKDELWGTSLVLYALIGRKSIDRFSVFENISSNKIHKRTPILFDDPALERCFRLIQQKDITIFKHPYLRVLNSLCKHKEISIRSATVTQLECLHSGLLFSDPFVKELVVKQMLSFGKNFQDVYIYINDHDLFLVFIEECLKLNWKNCFNLSCVFFKLLAQKPKDSVFKQKLVEMGIINLVLAIVELDLHTVGFFEFIKDFTNENTLTIMQILYDTGYTKKVLEMASRSAADRVFLLDTISYYGPHSVELIENAYTLEIFPVVRLIQALTEIPFYFKISQLDRIFLLLLKIFKCKKYKDEILDIIKWTIDLLTDLLFAY